MSLKAFHILFIILSIVLSLGFALWGFKDYRVTGDILTRVMAWGSLAAAVALSVYLARFFSKMKKIH